MSSADSLANQAEFNLDAMRALEQENTRLRAALAMSKDPCIYCQLPAEKMAECRSGFPGCGRVDDIMGCPELGSMVNERLLQERLATLARILTPEVIDYMYFVTKPRKLSINELKQIREAIHGNVPK